MSRRLGFPVPCIALLAASLLLTNGCARGRGGPQDVTMLIESSPASLDPRIGTDAQSEHMDSLLFDALVRRDEHFNVQPWLAERWETPDPLTYIFHLRQGVRFHNGAPVTAQDVKWTLDSMRNGTVITAKAAAFLNVDHVDAPDAATVIFHLKKPDVALLWNLSDGAFGVVPKGSGRDFGFHPVGSGPFSFVRQEQDKEVVLRRADESWQPAPQIREVRFSVVPDAITRALELEKGSADVCINCLTSDMISALLRQTNLAVESAPGTVLNYISFNTRDSILQDERVRQAIAFAINRPLIIHSLWRDRAKPAVSLLPEQHWAWTGDVAHYSFDPARANALLDVEWPRGRDGVRFHLAMKTSTDESSRLFAQILQQELREVGIALDVRSFEFATFYSDIAKGAFQMYTLRWVGGNEDPDIFRYAYATESFPPHGANRGHYANTQLDSLVRDASGSADHARRAEDYRRIQQLLAVELPSINLWYLDSVLVHNRRLSGIHPSPSGDFSFLRTATVAQP